MLRSLLLLSLPCILAAQVPAVRPAERRTLQVGAVKREYLIHLPAGRDKAKAGPLVLAFHGYTDSAAFMEEMTHFDRLADQYGFTVVFGEGVGAAWHVPGFSPRPKTGPALAPEDDVAYVKAILDGLVAEGVADPHAVYATGFSLGGYFSFYLASALNDRIAAIAPVSGSISEALRPAYRLAQPMPALLIHGTGDRLVPYGGKPEVLSAEEDAALLARLNGCAFPAVEASVPDRDSADGCTSIRFDYAGKAPVQLVRIQQGGHEWPNFLPHPQDRTFLGPMSRDFDASEWIWLFFSRFRR